MTLIIKRNGTIHIKEIHELSVDSLYTEVCNILKVDKLEVDILISHNFIDILEIGHIEEETTYMLRELLDDYDEDEEETIVFDKITGYLIVTNKMITINTYEEFTLT